MVAHCILDPETVVRGISFNRSAALQIVRGLLDLDLSIVQLPCPEFSVLGARRWAQSYEQYRGVFFERRCRAMAAQVMDHAEEMVRAGVVLLGAIGVEGSPTCSVYANTSADYGGALPADGARLPESFRVRRRGVFVEFLAEEAARRGIGLRLYSLPRGGGASGVLEDIGRLVERSSCGGDA